MSTELDILPPIELNHGLELMPVLADFHDGTIDENIPLAIFKVDKIAIFHGMIEIN